MGGSASVTAPAAAGSDILMNSNLIAWDQLTIEENGAAVLGKGSYGTVVRAKLSKKKEVAVKVMIPNSGVNFEKDYSKLRGDVQSEVKILRDIESKLPFRSDHMIEFLGVVDGLLSPSFQSEFGNKKAMGIVMRLEAGGTLADYLRVPRGLGIVDRLHIVLQLARVV